MRRSLVPDSRSGWMLNLVAVRWRKQHNFAARKAVDDVEIVGHVPAQNGNIAAAKIGENTKQPLNVHQFPVVSDEAEASPSEDAGGLPSDASEFRRPIGIYGKRLKHIQEPSLKHRPISSRVQQQHDSLPRSLGASARMNQRLASECHRRKDASDLQHA